MIDQSKIIIFEQGREKAGKISFVTTRGLKTAGYNSFRIYFVP